MPRSCGGACIGCGVACSPQRCTNNRASYRTQYTLPWKEPAPALSPRAQPTHASRCLAYPEGVHLRGTDRRFLRDVCADTALEVHVFTAGMELYASPLLDTCARRAIVCNAACLRLQQGATYRVAAALHVLRPLRRSMQRHCADST